MLSDVISILASISDAVGEALVGVTLGFAMGPTGVGFILGAILILITQSYVTASFEVESLTIVSKISERNWEKMCYIIFTAGLIGAVGACLGVFGALRTFIEGPILYGMMSGVGVLLCFVAFDTYKENKVIGTVSLVVAIIVYCLFINDDNNLIYAMGASIVASILVARFASYEEPILDKEKEKLQFFPILKKMKSGKFLRDGIVWKGALGLLALRIGTSISYSGITSEIGNVEVNVDHTNIVAGFSGMTSALFGGSPLEPVISVTSAAEHPIICAAVFMVIMGVLLLSGILLKIVKYIPTTSIVGLLFLLGAFIGIPSNIQGIVNDTDAFSGPVTMVVTVATSNPFFGMLAGIVVRAGLMLAGAV